MMLQRQSMCLSSKQMRACVRECVGVLRVRGGACVCEGMSERVSE